MLRFDVTEAKGGRWSLRSRRIPVEDLRGRCIILKAAGIVGLVHRDAREVATQD